MASPIQKIKQGLINGDLKEIAEGYSLLTGEEISVSSFVGRYTLQQTIDMLFDTYENYHSKPTQVAKNESKKKPVKEPVAQKGYFGNQSVPITEKAAADEIEKNKQNVIEKPKRKPKQVYKINCSVCQKPFDSDVDTSDNFGKRCNDCLVKAINGRE